ncbi:MAG: hypothetical protein ACJ74Z_00040 [Bryobacteraceae bacterium]
MNTVRSISIQSFLLVLFSPLLSAADLSTYRGFQFGMSLNAAVKHSGMNSSEVTVLHQRSALIQELKWRPSRFAGVSGDKDPVDQVQFAFLEGQLFRIVVGYDREKITGLTTDDLIDGISAQYGAATVPGVTIVLSSQFDDENAQVLARWEDADYSLNLVQLPYSATLKIIIFQKDLNARAEAAIAEGIRLETEEAPGLAKLQEQKAKADLDRNRLVNKARFRP